MSKDFTGRAVIVTGASSGIGRAIAVELGRAGAEVWLVGRAADELATTTGMIAEVGGPAAHAVPMNLRERGPLAKLVAEVAAKHPYLFALVSNAGVMHPEPIMSGTIERWQTMLDVNVMAMLEGNQAAVHAMRAHKKPAHLINIGSVQGRFEEPGVYGISKRAAEFITSTLRAELEQDDIRVCTVIPGGFTTQLARGFAPEQMAHIAGGFEKYGIDPTGPGIRRVLSDPQHIDDMVRYILAAPIELNIEEVVMRPPISMKA